MNLPLVVKPLAECDIRAAKEYYDAQPSSRDLAAEFVADLDAFFERIQRHPQIYAIVKGGARLGTLDRFPYVVCYRLTESTIEVLAVYHSKRSPKYWKSRV